MHTQTQNKKSQQHACLIGPEDVSYSCNIPLDILENIKNLTNKIQKDVLRLQGLLAKLDLEYSSSARRSDSTVGTSLHHQIPSITPDLDDDKSIHGVFDGYFMVDSSGRQYPVPLNYASKSKLIQGDMLKLQISSQGEWIYKLINPAPRKHIKATLSMNDQGKYIAVTDDGKTYNLNQAAVSFFKGRPGDQAYIVTNAMQESTFAAVEAIIQV